jgi:hypothetical protein
MPWIMPLIVSIALALTLTAVVSFRPKLGRAICGGFFLLMGLGVNLPLAIIDPTLFALAGARALLPVYRWFFTDILMRTPLPFVIALIAIEVTIGVLILSRGKAVRLGLLGACLFCLFITPVGVEELAAPLLIVPYGLLMRQEFNKLSVPIK